MGKIYQKKKGVLYIPVSVGNMIVVGILLIASVTVGMNLLSNKGIVASSGNNTVTVK